MDAHRCGEGTHAQQLIQGVLGLIHRHITVMDRLIALVLMDDYENLILSLNPRIADTDTLLLLERGDYGVDRSVVKAGR